MKYRAYRTKSDNRYRFQFLSDTGMELLTSRPFDEQTQATEGIRYVISNAAKPDLITNGINAAGKHYYYINGENGTELARSVLFDSVESLNASSSQFLLELPTASLRQAGEAVATDAAPYAQGLYGTNNYKPLAFYEARLQGNIKDGFESFQDEESNEFYFTYNLDGHIILISEGYQSESSRDNGINSVKNNLPNPQRYITKRHPDGQYFFDLRAGNNQEIATSIWFDSESDMQTAVNILNSGENGNGRIHALFYKDHSQRPFYGYRDMNYFSGTTFQEEFGFESFEDGEDFFYTINYENEPQVFSEIYKSAAERDKGIKDVKKYVKVIRRYHKDEKDAHHRFKIISGNGHEMAISRNFDSDKDREKVIRWLLGTGGTRKRKKAERAKTEGERTYLLQNQDYPFHNVQFDTFRSGGNQRYYFNFKSHEGKVLLINADARGLESEDQLRNTTELIKKYGPDRANYERKETKNGKYYYYIKDHDGHSIARSSLFYDTEEEMESSIKQLLGTHKAMGVIENYQPCDFYKKDPGGFVSFHSESDNSHYFAYNDEHGTTVLRSEAYTTASARDNGIQSVLKNAPLEGRWITVSENGEWFYALRAGNNQEIARSCAYTSETDMLKAAAWVAGPDSPIGVGSVDIGGIRYSSHQLAAKAESDAKAAKKGVIENYQECEFYKKDPGFVSFYHDEDHSHYFAFNNENGTTLLRSEAYTSAAARDNGIQSVIKNAPIEERWGHVHDGDQWFYFLRAGNNQEIARSCGYNTEDHMLEDMEWLRSAESSIGAGSEEKEGVRYSANALAALAAAAVVKPQGIIENYQPCEFYKKDPGGFVKFFHEEDNSYYFAYNNEDGKTLLRSEAYTTEAARDNGVESVRKNSPLEERWKIVEENGAWYHVLRAANHQEIARSCAYSDKALLLADFKESANWFLPLAAVAAAAPLVAEVPPPKPKDKEDDYLPCKEYHGHTVNDKINNIAFFKHSDGQYYFAVYYPDGKVRLRSEGFRSSNERDVELSGVLKYLNEESAYTKLEQGDYYMWVLKDKSGREVGRSCLLKKGEMVPAVPLLATAAAVATAPLVTAPATPAPKPAAVAPPPTPQPVAQASARGGMGWLPWLIGALVLAALAFLLLRNCKGCSNTPAATIPTTDTMTSAAVPAVPTDSVMQEAEAPTPDPNAVAPVAACDFSNVKLTEKLGTMATFLSAAGAGSQQFSLDGNFGKGSAKLPTAMTNTLEGVATLAKMCESFTIEVYGNMAAGEKATVAGSKELTLTDARADAVVAKLRALGVPQGRVQAVGQGTGTSASAEIVLKKQ